jgi:hypothetical protein
MHLRSNPRPSTTAVGLLRYRAADGQLSAQGRLRLRLPTEHFSDFVVAIGRRT